MGSEPRDCVVIHIDLDYFFAQIEEREHPEYRDKPVVVCVYSGRTEDSGAVSTANYVARKYGVRSGIPIVWAKKRLEGKNPVFLPVNHDFYRLISDEIMGLVRGFGDRFEQVSVDEAYLDVTERVRGDFKEAHILAKQIKDEILRREGLTCSVGVGPNKLVAKVAANWKKPDGLTVVSPDDVKAFLHPLPVGRLRGVGRKTESVLLDMGVKTIGDLAVYPLEKLFAVFGKVLGTYFHRAADGIDDSVVQEKEGPKSMSRITTLKTNTRSPEILHMTLKELCKHLMRSIETEHLCFRTVSLLVVAEDMSLHSKSLTLPSPTDELKILENIIEQLLGVYLKESIQDLRRIGVRLSSFAPLSGQTNFQAYLG